MDAFWKWLMRANARGVFLASICAFLAVASWWSWKEMTRGEGETVTVQTDFRAGPRKPLALLALIQKEADRGGVELPVNPFVSPFGAAVSRRPLFTFGRRKHKHETQVVVVPRDDQPVEKPKPRPKPKPKEVITLKYGGVFRRADGQLRSLVMDSQSGHQKFYSPGDNIAGLADVDSFTEQTITITLPNGNNLVLLRDHDATFEDGKCVNPPEITAKEVVEDGQDTN